MQMGTLTISRFFVLHVFILPGLLFAFIATHIFLFRKAGAAGPIQEDSITPKLPTQGFYPRQVAMDMVASLLIVLALALVAHFFPIDLGPRANPADASFVPRPEWYYLPLFQWLKIVSGHWSLIGGIVLPAFLALLFAVIPFLDRRRERRPWRRPIVIAGFAIFIGCYAALGAASYHDDASDPSVATQLARQKQAEINYMRQPFQAQAASGTTTASLAASNPQVTKGATIYAAQSCNACHGENGAGSAAAQPLVGIGQKYSAEQLAHLLHNPSSKMIQGGMPAFDLNEPDTDALVAYLRSLK